MNEQQDHQPINKFAAGAVVIALVLIIGGMWYYRPAASPLTPSGLGATEKLLSSKYVIKDSTAESFGDLSKVSIVPSTKNDNLKMAAPVNATASPNSEAPTGLGGGGNPAAPTGSPDFAPEAIQYVFNYKGGDLPQLPETQGVLKRVKPQQPQGLAGKIISLLSFGLVDLNKLNNASLSSVNFNEDKANGYQASVDMDQGNVYFNKNWASWPVDNYNCMEVGCVIPNPIKIDQLPPDSDMIAAADQFISTYGISKDGYGSPIVNNQWRVQYENASPAERIGWYIPEQLQVIYPLIVEGKQILDESGFVYGMSVYVDARTKQVTSVSDLVTKQFERSSYKGVTSADKILDVVKKGGYRNYGYEDPHAKKVQLNLDTPTIQTVKMWYSPDNYKTNNELYVPVLVFPIKNWKEANYWRPNVYVPLVQDILNTDDQPPIMPMSDGSPKPQ